MAKRNILILLASLFILLISAGASHAAVIQHTDTSLRSITTGEDGSLNSTYERGSLAVVPDGMNTITYIKGRYRLGGNAPNILGKAYMAHYINSNGVQSNGNSDDKRQILSVSNTTSALNTWYNFEYTFNVNEGEGIGNKVLITEVHGKEYKSFYMDLEITEIRYNEYTFEDVHLEINSDNYVKLVKSLPISPPFGVVTHWYNQTDGRAVSGTIDTLVTPEKTYNYTFYANIGSRTTRTPSGADDYGNYPIQFNLTIKVPSDATRAMEAAQNAEIQVNMVANDTNYIRNDVLSVDAGIIRDNNSTVLDEARRAASQTWDAEEGKSVIQISKEARDIANEAFNAITNIQNYTVPQIIDVKGVGGATCTTNSSYSVVVACSPDSGVTLNATVIGPSHPTVSVSNNTITFNDIISPGAYTATITASNGAGATQKNIMFFKI